MSEFNIKQATDCIKAAARDLAEDNDRAEQAARLQRALDQVMADAKRSADWYAKRFPQGVALSNDEEIKLMKSCFPMVAAKGK